MSQADATERSGRSPAAPEGTEGRVGRTVFLLLFFSVFWFILSGKVGVPYFTMMLISLGIVLALNRDRPFPGGVAGVEGGLRGRLGLVFQLLRYMTWLVMNVMKANLEVAYMVLHPRLPIRPALITFRTELEHPVAQVLVANSITLTPGTVTINLKDGEYLIHALHPRSALSVTGGELQNVVARVFQAPPEPAPDVQWHYTIEGLRK